MFRAFVCLALAVVSPVAVSETVRGQASAPTPREAAYTAPLLTSHPTLLASLERITSGSVLWREGVNALRQSGRVALILTPEEVVFADPRDATTARPPRDPQG